MTLCTQEEAEESAEVDAEVLDVGTVKEAEQVELGTRIRLAL